MRVLLHTNAIISAILFGGIPRQTLEAVLIGDLELVTSPALLTELESILVRKFEFRGTAAASVRSEMESIAELVEPEEIPTILRDVPDNEVLAAADEDRVNFIVTGDKELLVLGSHGPAQIISPRAFLNQFVKGNP